MDGPLPSGQAPRLLVAALAAILWFALLGYRDLVDPDEGRYADIPHTMVASGDWVTPRLNGLKYFEKPPLQYWATAVSFELFGESNASARLWVALIGFAGALWAWYLGTQLFGRDAGFFAFLITLSTLLYAAVGHLLTLDMSLSVFLFLGVGSLLLAQREDTRPETTRRWMLLGWAALALAVLTKGLVGVVLPAAALVVYSLWQRDWALWGRLHLGKGLLLLVAITAPWFLLVSHRNPEFPDFFFIREHLERYTTALHGREGPVWYFALALVWGVLPWLVPTWYSLVRPGFRWWAHPGAPFDPERFLWAFILFVVLFFSLGRSKLIPYVLPAFPALGLLLGKQLAVHRSLVSVALVQAALGTLGLLAGWRSDLWASPKILNADIAAIQEARPWLLAAGACLLTGGLSALALRRRFEGALVALSLSAILGFQVLGWGFQVFGPSRSGRALAEVIRPYAERGAEVYSVSAYFQSVSFYLGSPLIPVMYRGELALGIEQAPERAIPDWEGFVERWRAAESGRAIAIFETREFPELAEPGLPMRTLYQDRRKLAVVKP